ncbi:class III poly(R)-hydroxyalkanoic acid synthase subunit PhaE [Solilutibacter silvestris]|nr:class III poly(R)-hydroxyalkanoic acid synthase subunit PhaE [Lysobacter silvestris]
MPGMGAMPGMGGMPNMGGMMGGAPAGWREAMAFWNNAAMGIPDSGVRNVADRMNAQASVWWGEMQKLAAQFSAGNAGAAEIAAQWRQAMDGQGNQAVLDMFKGLQGADSHSLEAWYDAARPWIESWRRETQSMLGMPTFGLAREHQERMQALMQSQMEYQDRLSAYNALLLKASQDATSVFETLLAKHEEPGKQLTSARALFDLWIDAAEQAYAKIALSPEFRTTYGDMVNAQMRLRQQVQREIEQLCGVFGMPTRTEIDAAHRKIAELERMLRRQAAGTKPASEAPAARKPARKSPASTKARAPSPTSKTTASKRPRSR